MSVDHEQLVAYALEQLEADERAQVEAALTRDAQLATELAQVRAHLDIHDAAPAVEPAPRVLVELRRALETEDLPQRPLHWLGRFGMPIAAAALVALAFFWPPPESQPLDTEIALARVHGEIKIHPRFATLPEMAEALSVTRYRAGDVVSLTFDEGARFSEPADTVGDERLLISLYEGRVFVEADAARLSGGLLLMGGRSAPLTVQTLGTSFFAETTDQLTRVGVESGEVRVTLAGAEFTLAAGEAVEALGGKAARISYDPSMRDWFAHPTLLAVLEDDETLRVTLRNDMPDPVLLEPPTGGEAPFYASVNGRTFPLPANRLQGYPLNGSPRTLQPGETITFTADLQQAVPAGASVTLSDHRQKLRTVAEDRR